MPPGGYHGRYARVDLSHGRIDTRAIDESVLRRFLGGSGLGTWLLLEESEAGFDPLGEHAPIVVALSPLVGSPLTTSAKFAVVTKSPLTQRINDALASDRFAIELKRSGVDALTITGAAPEWSILVVDGGELRVEPASDLVGLSAWDAEARVRERLGSGFRFLGIGPAGEIAQRHVLGPSRYRTLSGCRQAGV